MPRTTTILIALFSLAIAGCALFPPTPQSADAVPDGPLAQLQRIEIDVPEDVVALQTQILVGEMAVQRGLRRRAAEAYVAALAYTNDPEIAGRATRIALYAGAYDLALQAARVWVQTAPESAPAHRAAAGLALRTGNAEGLGRYAAGVVRLDQKGPEAGLRTLADILSGDDDHAELALAAMQKLVSEHASSADAQYALALLALRYQRYQQAEGAIELALALRPDWDDAALLRTAILVRKGDLEAAGQWIAAHGGNNQERAEYQLAFARILLDAGHQAAAADAFERALALRPDYADARYGLGILALTMEQWERARKAFATLYDAGQQQPDAAYYLGLIAEQREDYSQARDWYGRVSGGRNVFDARIRAAAILYKMGDLAAARAELEALRRSHPELARRLYIAEGQLLFTAQEYGAALAVYNKAIDAGQPHPDLLYARSLVYEKLGAVDKAMGDLRTILTVAPDDARALNALGYMLSNHSDHYQEALGYVQRALAAKPDDPAVIDSMGWVQYRLGNLTTARDYLRRAYAKLPDPEVAAHLGEVLWQLGEKQKARRLWQDALAEHPDHHLLRETIERLTP